jgi:hypothetical protein
MTPVGNINGSQNSTTYRGPIMNVMDLQAATIAHLQWKLKLSEFVNGVEDLSASQVPDHTSCQFGQWLYNAGLQKFSGFQEMKELVPLHREIHDRIKQMVAMPEAERKAAGGRKALNEFRSKCDRFVHLLDSVEARAKTM